MIKPITHNFRRAHTRRSRTDTIVIHHSKSHDASSAEIHRWHLNRKPPFYGIGYHYVIRSNGSIETGRPDWSIGAHAGASINGSSVGVCLTGRFMSHPPTLQQMRALKWLIKHLKDKYGELKVTGHKEHMSTSCPGALFPWGELEEEVEKVKIYLDGALLPEEGLLLNGRSYLPVRALAGTRYQIERWDGATKTVYLRSV